MAKMSKSKGSKAKSAPLFKGMGKSLADSAKPERSGGWRNTPLAKTATNQNYGGKSKGAGK